jgi:hypothetical protein
MGVRKMYFRIKYDYEVKALRKSCSEPSMNRVYDAIEEKLEILESAYTGYKAYDYYGGEVFLFTDTSDFAELFPMVCKQYKLQEEQEEYTDVIVRAEGVCWREKLYMLGSEYSVVMVFPDRE